MTIVYDPKMVLELWVRDTGKFDGYVIFVNQQKATEIGDQNTKVFPIVRPSSMQSVVIHFGGNDGGVSAIFDVANNQKRKLAQQDGVKHSYLIEP